MTIHKFLFWLLDDNQNSNVKRAGVKQREPIIGILSYDREDDVPYLYLQLAIIKCAAGSHVSHPKCSFFSLSFSRSLPFSHSHSLLYVRVSLIRGIDQMNVQSQTKGRECPAFIHEVRLPVYRRMRGRMKYNVEPTWFDVTRRIRIRDDFY